MLLIPCRLLAQVPLSSEWQSYIEEWAEELGATHTDELEELLTLLHENPINLNDTASDRILQLPFISPLQWDIIKAYILQYGEMLSINELYILNGFDTTTLQRMRPFVCVQPVDRYQPLKFSDIIQQGRGNMVMGMRRNYPLSEGYRDSTYLGSPLRAYFRYLFTFSDRVQFQLSGDKDPGEQFLYGAQKGGFDHYSYHLIINRWGPVNRVVIGRYNMQFGQGLTLWNGFVPWSSDATSTWRYGQGVKGAGAMSEYGYFNGAAAEINVGGRWSLTPFFSLVRRDATAPKRAIDSMGHYLWVQSIYESGYHRSELENSKKHQLKELMAGGRLQWKSSHFTMGVTAYSLWFDKPLLPIKYVYNYNAFRGSRGMAAGIDASYRHNAILLFGELSYARALDSLWSKPPLAGIVGAIFDMNAENRLAITLRNYSPTYQNLYSATNGRNSGNQNERGLRISWNTQLPLSLRATMMADFYFFPEMKYRIYAPSNGKDFQMKVYRDLGKKHHLSCQYTYRMGKRNTTIDGQEGYIQETIERYRWAATWDWRVRNDLLLTTKAMVSRFGCDHHETLWGWALAQDVEYKPQWERYPITLIGRLSIFDVKGYDARLYFSERSLQYAGGSMMMYGQGSRCYLTLHYELSERLQGGVKVAWTHYADRDAIGSGHDITEGNNRWECMLQLRLKFPPRYTKQWDSQK